MRQSSSADTSSGSHAGISTRMRIRRWALLKRVLFAPAVLGACLFAIFLIVALVRTVLGEVDPWWIWVLALGVGLASVLPWCIASARLDVARYADGRETVGTITEVVVHEPADPEMLPTYELTITAEIADHESIGRIWLMTGHTLLRAGQAVRFRHNTTDPDDLHDILFLAFVGVAPEGHGTPRRTQGSREEQEKP